MSEAALPNEGAGREIFLRALREYSERCSPPELTPGCPFAIETLNGARGCGEECVDLLAAHRAPPPVEEIRLGGGFALRPRRPRARHGGGRRPKPFDMGELYHRAVALLLKSGCSL